MEQIFEFIGNHWLLTGSFIFLLIAFITIEINKHGSALSAQQAVNLINQKQAIVIDVREKKDFKSGHIVNAINISHNKINSKINDINDDKNKSIIVVCALGQHSGAVVESLKKAGYTDVHRLSGGMSAWKNDQLPVIRSNK